MSNKNSSLTTSLGNWKISYPFCRNWTAPTDLPSRNTQDNATCSVSQWRISPTRHVKSNLTRTGFGITLYKYGHYSAAYLLAPTVPPKELFNLFTTVCHNEVVNNSTKKQAPLNTRAQRGKSTAEMTRYIRHIHEHTHWLSLHPQCSWSGYGPVSLLVNISFRLAILRVTFIVSCLSWSLIYDYLHILPSLQKCL